MSLEGFGNEEAPAAQAPWAVHGVPVCATRCLKQGLELPVGISFVGLRQSVRYIVTTDRDKRSHTRHSEVRGGYLWGRRLRIQAELPLEGDVVGVRETFEAEALVQPG